MGRLSAKLTIGSALGKFFASETMLPMFGEAWKTTRLFGIVVREANGPHGARIFEVEFPHHPDLHHLSKFVAAIYALRRSQPQL